MYRQLVERGLLGESRVELARGTAHHLLSVLRVKPGEAVELFDGRGAGRVYTVTGTSRHGVELAAQSEMVEHPASDFALTLFICVIKGNRMEWAVEKAVELGVARIVPVVSQRSVVRLDTSGGEGARVERWERVAEEAARQCGGYWLPEIMPPSDFSRALKMVAEVSPVLVGALTPGTQLVRDFLAGYEGVPKAAGWFVGPEGDLTAEELEQLVAAGGVAVSLGRQVLRAETAVVSGAAVLQSQWG